MRLLVLTDKRWPTNHPFLEEVLAGRLPRAGGNGERDWEVQFLFTATVGNLQGAGAPADLRAGATRPWHAASFRLAGIEPVRSTGVVNLVERYRCRRRVFERALAGIDTPDAVWVRNDPFLVMAARRRFGRRVPIVYQVSFFHFQVHAESASMLTRLLGGVLGRRTVQKALRICDHVAAISPAMADELVAGFGVERERVTPVPLAASPADAPADPDPRWDGVYIGTLQGNRQLETILGAWRRVTRERPASRLLVLGVSANRGDADRLRAVVDGLGLAESVEVRPPVPRPEVEGYLQDARIGISAIPPRSYFLVSSPTKLFEYMAAGIPVVASGEIPEQDWAVTESGGGVTCEFREDAIAEALLDLLSRPGEALEMGGRGRAWIREHRNWDLITRDVDGLLRSLVPEGNS